jgi:simple sugar transport system substrate-binding protein
MKAAAQRAVDAGIKVIAFDVNVENDKIPQIEQSDRDLARLVWGRRSKTTATAGRPVTSMSLVSCR